MGTVDILRAPQTFEEPAGGNSRLVAALREVYEGGY